METNNLTPDENLKERLGFNEDEEPVKICNTVEAPGIFFGEPIVHPDFIPDDDFPDSGSVIVYLFVCIGILIVIATIFCSIYFK